MLPVELKKLERAYSLAPTSDKKVLQTEKGAIAADILPTQLTTTALQSLTPQTHAELIVLFLNFPPPFYDTLWGSIKLDNPKATLKEFAEAIELGFFNVEQRQELAKAIVNHHQRLGHSRESILYWAATTNDPVFLQEAFQQIPKDQWLHVIKTANEKGNTALHSAASHPETLKIILALLTRKQRLAAVKKENKKGFTVLHCAADNIESCIIILQIYPQNQRLEALKLTNKKGLTIIHQVGEDPEFLKNILLLLPKDQRVRTLKIPDSEGNTILHQEAKNPETLHAILMLLPINQRLGAVKVTNNNGFTVLHQATGNSESLKIVLGLYPEDKRLSALKVTNKMGSTALHQAALTNPDSLRMILNIYPREEILDALKVADNNGLTVIDYATPLSYKVILSFYPGRRRLALLRTSIYNQSILEILIANKIMISSSEDGFQGSFVPEYIKIGAFLTEKAKEPTRFSWYFFGFYNDATKLINGINNCYSFSGD